MQKLIASFISPGVIFIWYSLYALITHRGFALEGLLLFINDFLAMFFLVYLYALPAFILIGVPVSLLIEYLDKGIRWVNYCLAGVVGGIVVLLTYPGSSLDELSIELIVFYMLSGLSFYIALKWVEIKDRKLKDK